MDRMKTFFKYAIWIILFFIFSEILINIGLKTSSKNIKNENTTVQEQTITQENQESTEIQATQETQTIQE